MSIPQLAQAQGTFGAPVTITNNYPQDIQDYAALLIFDSQTPIAAGKMQSDLRDLRFSNDCSGATQYDYYVWHGANTNQTAVWIRIPYIDSMGTVSLLMTYGDTSLTAVSNFNATFPNALITGGSNYTLSGNQYVGWLEVEANDTIFVPSGGLELKLFAGYANVQGAIVGNGSGYASQGANTVGAGPAGGGYSTASNSGAGGAGNGGAGGTGGYDAGDTPGVGGAAVGTNNDTDFYPGSAGGSSDNGTGSSGGAAVVITGHIIQLSGTISVDASDVALPGSARGAGGGAGGVVLLLADSVEIMATAKVSAEGGNGGVGTSTANDSGGGGGGGRSKTLHSSFYTDAGATYSVLGGAGGPYGGAAAGVSGGAGTIYEGTRTFSLPNSGTEIQLISTTSMALSTCQGDTVYIFGMPQTNAGAYRDTFTSVYGCDSIVIVNLSTITPINVSSNITVCQGDTALIHGVAQTAAGVYSATYTSSTGCDSISEVTLAVLQPSSSSSSIAICDGETAIIYGMPQTVAGVYTMTTTNAVGCDSTISTTLIVNNPSTSSITETACDFYTTPSGNTITVSGTYTDTIANSVGCDSIITLQITIDTAPTVSLIQTGDTLMSNITADAYQWFDCGSGNVIPGATGQTFIPVITGTYGVQITVAGCTSLSNCINVIVVGTTQIQQSPSIQLYPNPNQGVFVLSVQTSQNTLFDIEITDVNGRVVHQQKNQAATNTYSQDIHLNDLSAGMYMVRVTTAFGSSTHKMVIQQ